MNSLLNEYFSRIKSVSKDSNIHYALYERDASSLMPYSVHIRFVDEHGNTRDSWGSGLNKDEAFGKALMEMIERIYFTGFSSFNYKNVFGLFRRNIDLSEISKKFELPIKYIHPANTNGVAIHSTHRKALIAGMLELIERHVILFCLASKIGPHFKFTKELAKNKCCSFYVWDSPLNTYTVVGAFKNEGGAYFSSSCDFNKNNAILKAELELNSFLFLKDEMISETGIVKDDLQSFNRYHRYSGDFSAIQFLERTSQTLLPELKKERFFYSDFPVPKIFEGLNKIPTVRVIHPDVQQLFFDNWDLKYLNPRVFPKNQELPTFPHIIA